jgi:Ca2+-binding RTX toxin-like protein
VSGATTVSATGNQDIDGLLSGYRWTSQTLTYSFPTDASFYGTNYGSGQPYNAFEGLNATQQAVARTVFSMVSGYTNLTFVEVTETATIHADLRLAMSDVPSGAHGYYPSSQPTGGDSWYNNTSGRYDNPILGAHPYFSFMHEIGHGLGLKHGHELDMYGPMTAAHDGQEFSLMTYRSYIGSPGQYYTNETWGGPQSMMMYDIAALQTMYGANYTTNTGNTTYRWDAATGRMSVDGVGQATPGANRVYMTVWDGGGNDTYDLSNYASGVTVDLRPGEWTTTSAIQLVNLGDGHYARGNVANALLFNGDTRSLIENAVGGAGGDVLYGNVAANVLDGRGGSDTVVLAGRQSDYVFAGTAANLAATSSGITDTLLNVEFIRFLGSGLTVSVNDLLNDDTAAGSSLALSGPLSFAEGNNGLTAFTFTVTRAGDTSGSSSANWGVSGSGASAASAADFFGGALPSGTVTFAAGEVTKTITINVSGDTVIEGNETFTLTLSSPSAGTTITTGATTGTIRNDDVAASNTPTEGDDKITGTAQADTINGLGGHDTIDGGDGDDYLIGGAGNDILIGGAGIDRLEGGLGDDVYYADNSGDQIIEKSNGGVDTVLFSGTGKFTLKSNVENLELTGTADSSGTGNSLNNQIIGNAGKNILNGGDGNDDLKGEDGNDKITGGSGDDVIYGGAGSDTAVYSETREAVTITRAADGAIIVRSASGTDFVREVEFFSFAGKTFTTADLVGSIGSSLSLSGPVILPEVNSGSVAFTFTVSRSGDTNGASTASWAVTGSGTNAASASDFVGGVLPRGTVAFAAGETTKMITVNVAGDAIVEPDETFTLTLSSPSSGTSITTATTTGTIRNDDLAAPGPSLALSGALNLAEGDSGTTAFIFTVTRSGDISGVSSANWAVSGNGGSAVDAADFLGGVLPSGTVSFAAGESTKTLTVNVAGDRLAEAHESFTLTLSSPSAGTSITNGTTAGTITNDDAPGPSLTLSGPLNLAEGDSGTTAFIFTVTRSGDISGFSSADWVVSGNGASAADAADFLGGVLPSGTVSFAAWESTKTITVNVAGDAVVEGDEVFTLVLSASSGTAIANGTTTGTIRNDDTAAGGNIPTEGDDRLVGTNLADRINGLGGHDTIDGGDGDDYLTGGAGNDILIGGIGNDTLDGGLGDDTYYVESTGDLVNEKSNAGTDTVYSSAPGKFILKTNIENLVLTGTGDISGTGNSSGNKITGNSGNNTITGVGGDDTIFGMDGNDVIEGGAGWDTLSGGTGSDTFVFRSLSDVGGGSTGLPSDILVEWGSGDKIDVSKIDAIASTSTNDKFTFLGTGAFTGAGQLRTVQNASRGETYVEGDVNGDGRADFSLVLTGVHNMAAADFVL